MSILSAKLGFFGIYKKRNIIDFLERNIMAAKPHYIEKSKSLEDAEYLFRHFKKSLCIDQSFKTKKDYMENMILIATYLAYCISANELETIISPIFGNKHTRTIYSNLVKSRLLERLNFVDSDMNSKVAYRITKLGYNRIANYLPDEHKISSSNPKVYHTRGFVPDHAYGLGVTLLNILMLDRPFFYKKECVFDCNLIYGFQTKKNARVDCRVDFPETKQVIFIEHDTGSEHYATLATKLLTYHEHNMFAQNTTIVFTCHQFLDFDLEVGFCKSDLMAIEQIMKERNMSLYELYNEKDEHLTPSLLKVVESLLVKFGAYWYEKDGTSTLCCDEYNCEYIGFRFSDPCMVFVPVDVPSEESIIKKIEKMTINGKEEAYMEAQLRNSNKRLFGMSKFIWKLAHSNQFKYVFDTISYYNCYFCPSMNICKIMPKDADIEFKESTFDILYYSLIDYYPDILKSKEVKDYQEILFDNGKVPSFASKRMYITPSNHAIVFEWVDYSLSALCRMKYLLSCELSPAIKSLHIICISENESTLIETAKFLETDGDNGCFDINKKFKVSFIQDKHMDRFFYGLQTYSPTKKKLVDSVPPERRKRMEDYMSRSYMLRMFKEEKEIQNMCIKNCFWGKNPSE